MGTYETRNVTEQNQLVHVPVKICSVTFTVPTLISLFSIVQLYLIVFLY